MSPLCLPGLVALALLLSCTPGRQGLKLTYTLAIKNEINPSVRVSLDIEGIRGGALTLRSYEPGKYIRMSELTVRTREGVCLSDSLVIDRLLPQVISIKIDTEDHGSLHVSYVVRPGAPIGGGHGRHPEAVSSYLAEDFSLLAGRNLFLVPEALLRTIQVRIDAPDAQRVIATWPEVQGADQMRLFLPRIYDSQGPEDLVNGTIALGSFETYEEIVEGALVRVYAYAGWPEVTRNQLAQQSFALYQYMAQVFGASVTDPYTLIFAPKTSEDLDIRVFASSHGQARTMWPPTPSRWISCGEEMAYRWLRYPPHRMEFADKEDMWFVDGAAVYYALRACAASKAIETIEPYMVELYARYNGSRLSDYEAGRTPSRIYDSQSTSLRRKRRQLGPVFADKLDAIIRQHTDSAKTLQTVMELGYELRHDLDLRELIASSTGTDVTPLYAEYICPSKMPMRPLSRGEGQEHGVPPEGLPWEIDHSALSDTVTLLVSGKTKSFLEACGCKINQSGGVTRRASIIKHVKSRRNNVAVIDAGDAFPDEEGVPVMDDLSSSDVDFYLKCLERMSYGFSVIAHNEVYYGIDFLRAKLSTSPLPLIGANVEHRGRIVSTPASKVKAGPYDIGFIGIMGAGANIEYSRGQDNSYDVDIADPLKAIGAQLAELRDQCDYVGVIGSLQTDLVYRIVSEFPDLDLVITLGPRYSAVDVLSEKGVVHQIREAMYGFLGSTVVVYANAGVYGLHHIDIALDTHGRFVKMEGGMLEAYSNLTEEPGMKGFLEGYYREVAENEVLLSGNVEPLFRENSLYRDRDHVGTDKCASCHEGQYQQWLTTGHSDAYSVLLDAHRHQYAKCVICHVAGLGRPTGFNILEPNRNLSGVQCEICHGPGQLHISSPDVSNVNLIPPQQICAECHNPERDDDFEYTRDLRIVSH